LAEIRVSSAERDEAVAALAAHRSSGRLTHEEYELRLDRAQGAVARDELEAAVSPRPPAMVNPEWPGGRTGTRASRVMDVIGVLSLLVGLPLAIVLTAVFGLWWSFLIVLGIGVLAMVLGVAFQAQPAPGTLAEVEADPETGT
jgi:hypothetical protein